METSSRPGTRATKAARLSRLRSWPARSEEHTSELQSRLHLVCRLLLEKKKRVFTNRPQCCCSRSWLLRNRTSPTRFLACPLPSAESHLPALPPRCADAHGPCLLTYSLT